MKRLLLIVGVCVPWTAFAQISSQPNLTNPLGPPTIVVRPNPAPDEGQYMEQRRQHAYNAIVGPHKDTEQLRLQQQQYELQQLEIERQQLALQAEKDEIERQQAAQQAEKDAYWARLQQQAQRDLAQSKQQHKTKKKH